MNKITSIDDINALIAAGVEESTTLEYKSDINTTSDKWKGEMSKDVSAMANANGGTTLRRKAVINKIAAFLGIIVLGKRLRPPIASLQITLSA